MNDEEEKWRYFITCTALESRNTMNILDDSCITILRRDFIELMPGPVIFLIECTRDEKTLLELQGLTLHKGSKLVTAKK